MVPGTLEPRTIPCTRQVEKGSFCNRTPIRALCAWSTILARMAKAETIREEVLPGLFAKVRDGDEQAFAAMYRHLRRPLMAYCIAITNDYEVAQDAFHTTVLSVFEHRHDYRNGNLMGWIFTIARNTCRSMARRDRKRVSMDVVPEPSIDASNQMAGDEKQLIQESIMKLPEEFRQVILLKYFGDMSVEEIAASEEISTDLVKVRLYRARKRLDVLLRPHFEPHT